MGAVSRLIIPISWLALALAWKVQAGWPYILMMLSVLAYETVREGRGQKTAPSEEVST
jgi:membrane protein implicated in regulation of membrane protease activity